MKIFGIAFQIMNYFFYLIFINFVMLVGFIGVLCIYQYTGTFIKLFY